MKFKKNYLLILFCSILLLFNAKSFAQIPTNGLVAYYPFSNNANDTSGGMYNGAVNGSTLSIGRDGTTNCYQFDGVNDRILIPTSFDFLPRTVNLWFNAKHADYSDWRFIYESDNANLQNGLLELVVRDLNGQLSLFINAGNGRDTISIDSNVWYNANLYVGADKKMKFHLNGTLVTDKTFTSFLNSVNGVDKVVIGSNRFENSRFFAGKIDDISIFNRELSEGEIDSIYTFVANNDTIDPLDSLVAHYPFDGNANDTSGNGLHATKVNITNAADRFNNSSSSFRFNGTDSYVEFPTNFDFLPRTVNLWFKAETDDYSDWKFIYESDNPQLNYGLLELVLREEMGQLLLYINAGSCRDTVDVQVNTWYNVNLYVDSNKIMKFYLNGKLMSNKPFNSFLTSVGGINSVILGTDRFKLDRYFKGQIDDVRFYSYELSNAEINNIYNNGLNVCHVTVTDTLIINVNLFNSNPVTFNNTLKIYPNPTMDKINIDCGTNYASLSNASIRITNSLGQQMFNTKINQQNYLVDMSTWSGKGLYLVYIIDSKGNIVDVRKIILQ